MSTRITSGEALRFEPGAGSLVKTCGPAAVASPASATPSCRVKAPVLPGSAAAGQERIEVGVAVAADGHIVSPRAQEVLQRGLAAIGLAVNLIQQAMAVRVVWVQAVIGGVVVEQAEDPVERRIPLTRELPGDPGGTVEREAEPFHVRGALGAAADRALDLGLRAGADMPQVDGLVQGLVARASAVGPGLAPRARP